MTETTTLDRLALKFETTASHYIANRDQLFRLLTFCSLISYVVSIVWTVAALAPLAPYYDVYALVPQSLFWPVASVIANVFLLFLALGMRSRIAAQKPTGITLAAIFLIGNLVSGHIFIVLFGIYAFMNEPFRTSAREWSPQWYRDLCKQLD